MKTNPMEYYQQHPYMMKRILRFFNIERGFRPRVMFRRKKEEDGSYSIIRLYHPLKPNSYQDYGYPLTDINTSNFGHELSYAMTQHFMWDILDEDARKADDIEEFRQAKHIIGFTPVLDIDSPDKIIGEREIARTNPKVLEMFEFIRKNVREELIEFDIWEDTRLMWSGNGYYIIFPDFYGSKREIMEVDNTLADIREDLNDTVNQKFGDDFLTGDGIIDGKTGVNITNNTRNWNRFTKIPYTFHARLNEVSFPLGKENNLTNGPIHDISDEAWQKTIVKGDMNGI